MFTVTLGKAYYYDGFINIRVRYQEHFGEDKEPMTVHLGEWGNINPYECRIDRTTNNNSTPRIYMSTHYIHWVQATYKFGDEMKVEILNSDYTNAMLLQKPSK
jgi:hypothetical protein